MIIIGKPNKNKRKAKELISNLKIDEKNFKQAGDFNFIAFK